MDVDIDRDGDLDMAAQALTPHTQTVPPKLNRAAESVVRNIAEGAGRWSEADTANRYKIARGEAMECAASLEVLRLRKLITDTRNDRGLQLLEGVVAMSTKML